MNCAACDGMATRRRLARIPLRDEHAGDGRGEEPRVRAPATSGRTAAGRGRSAAGAVTRGRHGGRRRVARIGGQGGHRWFPRRCAAEALRAQARRRSVPRSTADRGRSSVRRVAVARPRRAGGPRPRRGARRGLRRGPRAPGRRCAKARAPATRPSSRSASATASGDDAARVAPHRRALPLAGARATAPRAPRRPLRAPLATAAATDSPRLGSGLGEERLGARPRVRPRCARRQGAPRAPRARSRRRVPSPTPGCEQRAAPLASAAGRRRVPAGSRDPQGVDGERDLARRRGRAPAPALPARPSRARCTKSAAWATPASPRAPSRSRRAARPRWR